MRRFFRTWSGLFVLLLAASMLLGGTLAWKSLDQTARNDMRQTPSGVAVELVKLEKKADGTATQTPIPGAEFFLFTAGGRQIGGRYVTDALGKIALSLEPGDYYFEETYPSFDYDFDLDGDGNPITRYPFTVKENAGKVVVTVYNRRAVGTLTVTKEVEDHLSPAPSEEQQSRLFTFTVVFSDGGSYLCRIDGGEPQLLASGGTFQLHHGQTAVFSGVPSGVRYTVTEEKVDGCTVFASGSHGTMVREGRTAAFKNVWNHPEPDQPPVLVVTKVLSGDVPPEDMEKEFRFTLTLNGEKTEFTLRPGANGGHDSVTFDSVKFGDVYCVEEAAEGDYVLTTDKASGTIALPRTEALFTNAHKSRPQVDVGGEKTWKGEEALRPASIPVRLYGNGLLVEEKTVKPNGDGKWYYTFTAPQFDRDGKEIVYTIQEGPVDGFAPTYDGRNIVNTPVAPVKVDPPILEKVVDGTGAPTRRFRFVLRAQDGAPLPDGAAGTTKRYTLDGSGEVELGWFTFTCPGTFVYTVHEEKSSGSGWVYDDALYTVTFVVEARDGELLPPVRTITRNGAAADKLVFHNRYTAPPQPTPSGGGGGGGGGDDVRHTPKPKPTATTGVSPSPTAGETAQPTPTAGESAAPTPTAAESGPPEPTPTAWETPVPTPEPTPDGSLPPGTGTPPPSVPKTGDNRELPIWFGVTVSGGLGLLLCLGYLYWKKHHYVGKRLMKK